jgi:hypothetical protein
MTDAEFTLAKQEKDQSKPKRSRNEVLKKRRVVDAPEWHREHEIAAYLLDSFRDRAIYSDEKQPFAVNLTQIAKKLSGYPGREKTTPEIVLAELNYLNNEGHIKLVTKPDSPDPLVRIALDSAARVEKYRLNKEWPLGKRVGAHHVPVTIYLPAKGYNDVSDAKWILNDFLEHSVKLRNLGYVHKPLV